MADAPVPGADHKSLREALSQLRLRLLDISGRNRLLNYKHPIGKSLQFIQGQPAALYERLADGRSQAVVIKGLPEPSRTDMITKLGRLSRPEPRDWAHENSIPTEYDLPAASAEDEPGLRALMYTDDLAKHCRKIEREAHLAIEETGANMLHLVLGFLEFPDQKNSERLFCAPLISVPVSISKKDSGGRQVFSLQHTGDDIEENLSLREKLRQDHSLVLPEFDEEAIDVEGYFSAIKSITRSQVGFKVRRRVSLCLLSFTNMLLVRDLDPDKWPTIKQKNALLDHAIVKQVFGGEELPSGDSLACAEEHRVEEEPGDSMPLVFDADSSQHSALVDVLSKGKNLVIVGPPGTGKSQTITNLIAVSIAQGKKVLFVSEKLAALEVVKNRLQIAGLAPLVLELHSTKTSKKTVLESIQTRLELATSEPRDLQHKIEVTTSLRKELKEYADLLNTVSGNQFGLTVHEIMWRAEKNRKGLETAEAALTRTNIAGAEEISSAELVRRVQCLDNLSSQFLEIGIYGPSHCFWGFEPEPLVPGDDVRIASSFESCDVIAERLSAHATQLFAYLGADLGSSGAELTAIHDLLTGFARANDRPLPLDLIPRFIGKDGACTSAKRECEELKLLLDKYHWLASAAAIGLLDEELATEDAERDLVELQRLGTEAGQSWHDAAQIETATASARSEISRLRNAQDNIRSQCGHLSIPLKESTLSLQQLDQLASLVIAAPIDSWEVQGPSLAKPGCVSALEALGELQRRWRALHDRLSQSLYLDQLPDEPTLKVAIGTLREGDAWYRLFQLRWRSAKSLHRRLQRYKRKLTAAARLSELGDVASMLSLEDRWKSDSAWGRYLDKPTAISTTDLAPYVAVATWNGRVLAAMEGLSNQFIDPVKLSSGEIRTWCRELGVLQVQIRLVLSATEALTALFPRAAERTDLEDFLSWSDQLIERVARLVTPLQKRSPRGVNLDTAIAAHRAALERRRLKAAVQSHDGARWLIGPEFRGVDTDIDAILAAISVAEIVIQLQIPGEVRSRLLGGNSVAIARELLPTLKSLTTAFEDLEEFASVIAGYGAFDLHKWVGDDPHKGLLGFSQHLLTRARLSYENRQLINQWAGYLSRRREAMDLGLAQLIQLLENGIVPPPGLGRAYRYAVFSTIIRRIFLQYPLLGRFSGSKHSRVRSEFQRLDREIIRLRGGDVSARSLRSANPPLGRNGTRVDDKTEMILVNHLLPQQRPRMTVRKFLARAGRAVQALKPCFMMGPQAVAQYLSPDSIKFDLVIMDEASQLKPEEAIGAVARGSQLVVVGDPKQLPPTSFFTKMSQLADEEDQFSTTDAESILDVCLAQFRPPRMLRWHYRSQHHSLIAFSNHYFYRDLVIFPSPYGHSSKLGVRVVHLSDAIYENQTNIREAERVVSAVVDHIASRPDDSVGVVTLNLKQRDLIAELLEERLETVSAADAFRQRWASEAQPLFIKNLENVQGDERDAIIISTTFGRPAGADAVRQNFGPISRQGGWRRLNVLFTRARKSIALFTSLSPEDIVVDGTTPEGTKALRNYLEYARSGSLNATQETGREPDSDFEISVIELLKTNGYEVTPQLGVAGYRIDIAVEHPDFRGAYLAAIECDGATYHSAQSVRDRDRIRQEIIESMGWRDRVWRIWSTDWFRTPRQEAARLLEFLADLRKNWRPDYASGESWIEETRGTGSTLESDSARIRENLIEEDEDATAVRVTDTVKYVDIRKADNVMTVQITEATTDLAAGLVHRGTPLAKTFLGATVGDEVTMHLPGASPRTFRILEITNAERTA